MAFAWGRSGVSLCSCSRVALVPGALLGWRRREGASPLLVADSTRHSSARCRRAPLRSPSLSPAAVSGAAGAFDGSAAGSEPLPPKPQAPSPKPQGTSRKERKEGVDKFLASLLWSCRNFVLAAVAGSLVMSALMFLQGTIGVWHCLVEVARAAASGHFTLDSPDVSLECVEILDKFLAGIVTYIFGTGIFELFINKVDFSQGDKEAREKPQWLHVEGIEDMEMRLGKVVITILVVNLMAAAKKVAVTQPEHLLYVAGALLLAALALTALHWVDMR